jgi:hypothetical protein
LHGYKTLLKWLLQLNYSLQLLPITLISVLVTHPLQKHGSIPLNQIYLIICN